MEAAYSRIGPWAWVAGAVLIGGAAFWYGRQPSERRDNIKAVAGRVGKHFLDGYLSATGSVNQAFPELHTNILTA
jgi:hypothetical protein